MLSAYFGQDMAGVFEMYKIDGFSEVYVTDSKGEKYRTVVIGECRLAFPLPNESAGFTLYFKDFAPLNLGQ